VLLRSVTTLVLSAVLLLGGLVVPSAGADAPVVAAVVSDHLDGLPAADDAVQQAGIATVSRPTATPMPFSLVGFAVPVGAVVEFRTSFDGQHWRAWTEVHLPDGEGPDPGSAEAAAAHTDANVQSLPAWVGRARWLQTRVAGARPEDVAVDLVDSLGQARGWPQRAADAVRAAWRGVPRAAAVVAEPEIVSRAEWDAAPYRGTPTAAERIRFGVVHHTAGSNAYTAAEAPAVVRAIQRYHTESNGWSDIGYNFLVDRFGTIYEGREGGIERAIIGAHAGGFNTDSFGVAIMGSFEGGLPPQASLDALADLLAWKYDHHHVDATSTVEVTSRGSSRYEKGRTVTLATLAGHRDVSSTSCPGDALYAQLPDLRAEVVERAGDVLLDPAAAPETVTLVRGESLDGAITFSTRLRPRGQWTLQVADADGVVVHADSGFGEEATSTWEPAGVATGTYTYTFASRGRRSASGTVQVVPPTIRAAAAEPAQVRLDREAGLAETVAFSAQLYRGASWRLTVSDPDGVPVHVARGDGETLRSRWSGPAAQPGTYRWRIETDEADPVTGSVSVIDRVVARAGDAGDAVGGAVALSRAAFPVPASAARAVLARADVFADAMAGGPLAGTAGPVLLTDPAALDERVEAELERVLPPQSVVYVLGGPGALADDVVAPLRSRWRVERLAGSDRTATAAAVAVEVVHESGATTALIARAGPDAAKPWADALAGGAYGAAEGIPVLLTDTDTLARATRAALAELEIADTIVLGGSAAVSDAVVSALPAPRRVFGADRAGTAVAVARTLWGRTHADDGDRIVLANGFRPDAWALALAASPLAARNAAPLLLTEADALAPATRAELEGLGYGEERTGSATALGGEDAVSEAVVTAVEELLQ
jgi:putative cell wall-binding protein